MKEPAVLCALEETGHHGDLGRQVFLCLPLKSQNLSPLFPVNQSLQTERCYSQACPTTLPPPPLKLPPCPHSPGSLLIQCYQGLWAKGQWGQ